MTPWYRFYRRLFFRRAGSPDVVSRFLGWALPRPCGVCGRRTRALAPYCELHRFEGEHEGDVNP